MYPSFLVSISSSSRQKILKWPSLPHVLLLNFLFSMTCIFFCKLWNVFVIIGMFRSYVAGWNLHRFHLAMYHQKSNWNHHKSYNEPSINTSFVMSLIFLHSIYCSVSLSTSVLHTNSSWYSLSKMVYTVLYEINPVLEILFHIYQPYQHTSSCSLAEHHVSSPHNCENRPPIQFLGHMILLKKKYLFPSQCCCLSIFSFN